MWCRIKTRMREILERYYGSESLRCPRLPSPSTVLLQRCKRPSLLSSTMPGILSKKKAVGKKKGKGGGKGLASPSSCSSGSGSQSNNGKKLEKSGVDMPGPLLVFRVPGPICSAPGSGRVRPGQVRVGFFFLFFLGCRPDDEQRLAWLLGLIITRVPALIDCREPAACSLAGKDMSECSSNPLLLQKKPKEFSMFFLFFFYSSPLPIPLSWQSILYMQVERGTGGLVRCPGKQ